MSTMVAQPSGGWRITAQTPTTDFSSPGQAVDGVRITFTTGAGVTDNVFIPNDRYHDLDYIRAQISTKVAQHAQVANLTG